VAFLLVLGGLDGGMKENLQKKGQMVNFVG